MNKLVAIFCVWGDSNDLIDFSLDNILPCVEGVIIVKSDKSNFGNYRQFYTSIEDPKITTFSWEPDLYQQQHFNETAKRQFGLDKAKELGFTHFLFVDGDEFYKDHEFIQEKKRVYETGINGVVHRLKVLFKKPTLMCDDHTLVPGISKLNRDTRTGNFRDFPFAYDNDGNAHIDPCRRLNYRSGIEMSEFYMYHASWVRSDFHIKIDNSSARNNLRKSSIYRDLDNAEPGVYNEFYRQNLDECPNHFNLPEYD
jgi:hypothetical protein